MSRLAETVAEAGGSAAPRERFAQLRAALAAALVHGEEQLRLPRAGTRGAPVEIAFAAAEGGILAVLPLEPTLRADPQVAGERAWLLAAAAVGALADAAPLPAARPAGEAGMLAGRWRRHLALLWPREVPDGAELAVIAFEDHAGAIDRLRAAAVALPSGLAAEAADLRAPLGPAHPLEVVAAIARLGGRPADAASVAAHEEAVLSLLGGWPAGGARPHAEEDPRLRIARRIAQRLAGMGKWGGYHTEFTHLARGFPGHDRALALEIGERLLAAGLLEEKQSVGQRHVFLNPRRAGDVYALIDHGRAPAGLELS